MNVRLRWGLLVALGLVLALGLGIVCVSRATWAAEPAASSPLGTSFTYQGQLKGGSGLVDGQCDFQFSLWDSAEDLTGQVGTIESVLALTVTNGLFTVPLDFGEDAFKGEARWLAVAVRCPAGGGPYHLLTPRQMLTAAPYALALPGLWTQQTSTTPNLLGGYAGNYAGPGVEGAVILGGGQNGHPNRVQASYGSILGGEYNIVSGKYGTISGGGSNTVRGFAAAIGGGAQNVVTGTLATVGGGRLNRAHDFATAIGGGYDNLAGGKGTTVGGGVGNRAVLSGTTVAGGHLNYAEALTATIGGGEHILVTGELGTVAGGAWITVTGDYATVGGGWGNTASQYNATVGGGRDNTASGYNGVVAGGIGNTAAGDGPTVGGGGDNVASGDSVTVGGGFRNEAHDTFATVSGGGENVADGQGATVGGGEGNTASAQYATVPGGANNSAAGDYAFAAGRRAKALHQGSFVWADATDADFASTAADQFRVRANGGMQVHPGANSLFAESSGGARWSATLRANNTNVVTGVAAYLTNDSEFATSHFANGGTGQVLYLENGGSNDDGEGGGDFIMAVNDPESDTQFRVATDGEVFSDVGFNTPASDMAEMLPAVAGLEPGDVLAIGPDGKLARSTVPYQAAVAGVYSTRPGFVGGQPVEGALPGHVPLAVLGVVPVKASAENGPIRPGDLLVASSLPGHAMRCEGPPLCSGRTLGKALEELDEGVGIIKMLVTLQ